MKLKKGASITIGRRTYFDEVPDKVLDAAKIDDKTKAKLRAPKEKKPASEDNGKGKGKDDK